MAKSTNKKVASPDKISLDKLLEYGDDNVTSLDNITAIKHRSGMYIEGMGIEAYIKMVAEVLDNSCDEHGEGRCNEVDIHLELKGKKQPTMTIRDHGPGMPPNKIVELLTKTHSGGKWGDGFCKNGYGGGGSSGTNGVGLTVVNALSISLICEAFRADGEYRYHEFAHGKHLAKKMVKDKNKKYISKHGTRTTFTVDKEVFDASCEVMDVKTLVDNIFQKSCLYPNLKFNVKVTENNKTVLTKVLFHNTLGMYLDSIDESDAKYRIMAPITSTNKDNGNSHRVTVVFSYSRDNPTTMVSFANAKHTSRGGSHIKGAEAGLLEFYNDLEKQLNGVKAISIKRDDIRPGLSLLVSAFLVNEDPSFRGQTKEVIENASLRKPSKDAMRRVLSLIDIDTHKKILDQIKTNIKAKNAADKARNAIKSEKRTSSSLIGNIKRFKCYSPAVGKDYTKNALYIVEGQSAGGFLKGCRENEFQGIYLLQGKIKNTHNSKTYEILKNDVIHDLKLILNITTNPDGSYNYDNIKYHKIIAATDADHDGKHIESLLNTLWYKHFPGLIEMGVIFVATPPLFRIAFGKKDVVYIKDNAELDIKMSDIIYNRGWRVIPNGKDALGKHEFRKLKSDLRLYTNYIEGHARGFRDDPFFIEDVVYKNIMNTKQFHEFITSESYSRIEFTPDRKAGLNKLREYMSRKFGQYWKSKTKPPLFNVVNKDGVVVHKNITLMRLYKKLSSLVKITEILRYKGLGEMSKAVTEELLMNPKTCKVVKLVATKPDSETKDDFKTLMGRKTDGRKVLYGKEEVVV